MFKSLIPFSFCLFLLVATGCDHDKPAELVPPPAPGVGMATVNIKVNADWGADNFILEQVYYDNYGNRVRVDNFQSYFAMVKLIKEDGTEVPVTDFFLHDYTKTAKFTATVEPGNYIGVKFGMGVPDQYNLNQDPAQYPSEHPLSVAGSQGMFWTWNSGYVFTKFEGKIDPTGTEGVTPMNSFSIHTGDAECYVEYSYTDGDYTFASGEESDINFIIQVDQILGSGPEGIDLETESNSSGASDLGLKFTERFLNSIVKE